MWTLDELTKKKDDFEVERNTPNGIDVHQENEFLSDNDQERYITDEEVNGLVDHDDYGDISDVYLLEYVRKNNRNKKGVLIAVKDSHNEVVIGWSLCRSMDTFDKYFGQEVAYERGCKRFNDDNHFEDVPPSITVQLDNFIDRCKKYFKGCEFPSWTI